MTRCGEDVTDEYAENTFHWTRDSGDMEADTTWNTAHAGMKSITFAVADIDGDVKISCTLTANGATYGSIAVDGNMDASHTPGELDANDIFVIEDGYLKVTTSRGNAYVLENGVLKAAGAKLNGSITAESKLFASQPEDIVEFSYDHNGLRTQKKVTKADGTVETTDYTLHGKLITHLAKGNNKLHFFYDNESRPAMVDFNGTFYGYIHNLQGDIVGILDSSGNLVVEYAYDAWGKPVVVRTLTTAYEALAKLNPFRYRGYAFDEETELYYLRSRYYDSNSCRFINVDSYPGKLGQSYPHNLFAYSYNSPVAFTDKDGYSAIASAAIGAISSLIAGINWAGVGAAIGKIGGAIFTAWLAERAAVSAQTPEAVRQAAGITGTMDAATLQSKLIEADRSVIFGQDKKLLGDYYYIAFMRGGIVYMIDLPLTFDEAMIALKSEEIMQPLLSSVTNRASWGIYTYTRENARALYIAMEGLDEITDTIQEAEYPGNQGRPGQYYAHWHTTTTSVRYHIWFGEASVIG